jgi:DNA gyrase subunit A
MPRRPTPPENFAEHIVDVDVSDEMRGSFLEYAYSVIYARAIPDARDGLKPVQRRILFQMSEMGLRPDRPYVKCARVIGDVMGKLHPHGDSAIYDAIVRLAQSFAMRLPLVDGHGNYGSLDDGPAAYRYCLAGDVRVRMADGRTIPIRDVVRLSANSEADANFQVLDKDGKPVQVTKVFNSGTHPTKRLTTVDGFEIRGSYNHPILCLDEIAGVPQLRWQRLDEVAPGTIVALARNAWTTAVPTAQEWMVGVLTGAWITEGFAATGRAGFSNTDKRFFDHVLHAYDALVGGPRYVYTRHTRPDRKEIHCLDVPNLKAFREGPLSDLIGMKSAAKRVPEHIWQGGPGIKRAFLMAALEGDGSVTCATDNSFTVQFHSYSRQLARDIQDLLLEFGIHSHLSHYSRGEYRVVASGRHNVHAFGERVGFLTDKHDKLLDMLRSLPRRTHKLSNDHAPFLSNFVLSKLPAVRGSGRSWLKNHNFDRFERWQTDRSLIISQFKSEELLSVVLPIMDSGYRFDRIKVIEEAGPAEVFSLRVASDDHSFLAGGFVNHNTEARLAPPAMLLTESLDEDVVDMRPNYDGQEQEPEVLPAAFPNLLVNGATGIAVGMATNMPPHNLIEVISAVRHLIHHPDATLDELMRHIPGPDLPTGGKVVGLDGIREAYETGRGSFRTRATARIESLTPRKKGIVITELPYLVGPERVRERIAELVRSKKLQGITDVEDYTDRERGLRLVVEIRSGFNPEAILEQLYRLTPLEDGFAINNVALVAGQPRTLGLKQLLEVYVAHRLEVVRRRTEFRRHKREERLHLVDGLLIALLDIDEVIQLIRTSDNAGAAKQRLMQVFDLSEVQATYILDTPLRRLTKYDRLELEKESERLRREIADLTAILESDELLRRTVSNELAEVAKLHGTPRRTVLLESAGGPATSPSATLEISDDPCWVLMSSTGLLARTSTPELPTADDRARHDVIVSAIPATTRGELGAVTSHGRVVRLSALDLPALPASAGTPSLAGGAPIAEFVALRPGERVLGLTTLQTDSVGLAVGTAAGVVKRMVPDHPGNKDEWDVIRLEPGDELVGVVELATGTEDLVFITSEAQLLRFPAASVRPQGRPAGGMAGVRVPPGQRVVFFGAVDPSAESVVVTVAGAAGALPGTASSTVKVTPYSEYPAKGRGTGGVRCHRLLRGEDGLILAWAGPWPARAATGSGIPISLPPPTGKRDGSGIAVTQPFAAVAGNLAAVPSRP